MWALILAGSAVAAAWYFGYFGQPNKKGVTGPALVVVYSPRCGHCIAMQPELAKLGSRVQGVPVIKIDGTAHPELAQELGATGYPHIVFVARKTGPVQQRVTEYTGERTAAAMTAFVAGQPAS